MLKNNGYLQEANKKINSGQELSKKHMPNYIKIIQILFQVNAIKY